MSPSHRKKLGKVYGVGHLWKLIRNKYTTRNQRLRQPHPCDPTCKTRSAVDGHRLGFHTSDIDLQSSNGLTHWRGAAGGASDGAGAGRSLLFAIVILIKHSISITIMPYRSVFFVPSEKRFFPETPFSFQSQLLQHMPGCWISRITKCGNSMCM